MMCSACPAGRLRKASTWASSHRRSTEEHPQGRKIAPGLLPVPGVEVDLEIPPVPKDDDVLPEAGKPLGGALLIPVDPEHRVDTAPLLDFLLKGGETVSCSRKISVIDETGRPVR